MEMIALTGQEFVHPIWQGYHDGPFHFVCAFPLGSATLSVMCHETNKQTNMSRVKCLGTGAGTPLGASVVRCHLGKHVQQCSCVRIALLTLPASCFLVRVTVDYLRKHDLHCNSQTHVSIVHRRLKCTRTYRSRLIIFINMWIYICSRFMI